ncbi:nucleoside-diphosphate kinase [Haliovirga abyssi]|uniref:Nucleoside diphosphate kinase n=1 Tax=Haliovirga abyssi TaxID=2996794 RepID=A0AAU9DD36_9FUSO|nr:nucleoside-diphosphate kinase [Haliovirga abyssi]BDU50222.1 nucleoside diphosphate kinase [Haliovirga abyssi]
MEKSFVMVKPDGVQRELVGEIIGRFEKKGVKVIGLKLMVISEELARKHYAVHEGKSFFEELIKFITSGPVVAMVMEGEGVIGVIRKMVGATKPGDADPGTIRGDFVLDAGQNIIHASDSKENAEREIDLFFAKEEIIEYSLAVRPWIYSLPKID